MRSGMLIGLGILALLASGLSQLTGAGELQFRLHLPDSPFTRALQETVGQQQAAPPRLAPMRLRIPAIGVDAAVEILGVDADGQMEAPVQWEDTGWYQPGPRPGENGQAILLGHVDSHLGAAVFARLAELKPGDLVSVDDGESTRSFRVETSERHAAAAFPAERLFVRGGPSRLALVTCAGAFDVRSGLYRDRLIVLASYLPGA